MVIYRNSKIPEDLLLEVLAENNVQYGEDFEILGYVACYYVEKDTLTVVVNAYQIETLVEIVYSTKRNENLELISMLEMFGALHRETIYLEALHDFTCLKIGFAFSEVTRSYHPTKMYLHNGADRFSADLSSEDIQNMMKKCYLDMKEREENKA